MCIRDRKGTQLLGNLKTPLLPFGHCGATVSYTHLDVYKRQRKNPSMVSMRSVISSQKFQNTDMDLPVVFGKTISNEIFMADLSKMPHLLMAGATCLLYTSAVLPGATFQPVLPTNSFGASFVRGHSWCSILNWMTTGKPSSEFATMPATRKLLKMAKSSTESTHSVSYTHLDVYKRQS